MSKRQWPVNCWRHVALALLSGIVATVDVRAAEWQFRVDAPGRGGEAFLWVPPACPHVRGVIWGNQVILEKLILEDPKIRAAAARQGLAIVLTVGTNLTEFPYGDPAVPAAFQKIRDDLATASGYQEVRQAPVLPIGHSGGAIFGWRLAYWDKTQVLGFVGVHSATIAAPPWDPKKTIDGVPGLCISGEFESWGDPEVPLTMHWRWLRGGLLELRGRCKAALVSEVVQPGAGHFNWDAPLAEVVAAFIEKVAQRRLPPADAPAATRPTLLPVDPKSGWLGDIRLMTSSTFPPTAAAEFAGDPSLALWHLDREMADRVEHYGDADKAKLDQRVTFVEDGKALPAAWMEELKFTPEADGVTVRVAATFLDKTPEGVAGSGQPLGHATGPIRFRLIGGWGGGGEQTGPDTFRIRFSHFGIQQRAANLQVMAYHPGDERYRYAEQPAQIKFPLRLTEGQSQHIDFPQPQVPAGASEVQLAATSDSGLPVEYFVRSGPAEVVGNRLRLLPIPPRSRLPVRVEVVAYQYGRGTGDKVRSAEPVTRVIEVR